MQSNLAQFFLHEKCYQQFIKIPEEFGDGSWGTLDKSFYINQTDFFRIPLNLPKSNDE